MEKTFSEEMFHNEMTDYDHRMSYRNPSSLEYCNPTNNTVTDDGIYSQGLGENPIQGYNTPSPFMGFEDSPFSPVYDNWIPSNVRSDILNEDLPPEIVANVNSLHQDYGIMTDPFYFESRNNFSGDIAAVSHTGYDETSGEILGNGLHTTTAEQCHTYGTENTLSIGATAVPTSHAEHRRRANTSNLESTNVGEAANPPFMRYDQQYPNLEELRVSSPSSPSSNSNDAGTLNEEIQTPRRRRPRVCYSNLTEEEIYKRIRDFNNEASRHYREKRKNCSVRQEEQLLALEEENKRLYQTKEGLENLLLQMKSCWQEIPSQYLVNVEGSSGF